MENIAHKKQVDVLVRRYQALRRDLAALLEGTNGPGGLRIVRLWKELRGHLDRIEKAIKSINPTLEHDDGSVLPRPKVGDTVDVYRDHDGETVAGTIIEDDGDTFTVEVPEIIIPKELIPGFTVTAKWDSDQGACVN